MNSIQPKIKERHLLGLSGGKDSAALALHMRRQHPEIDVEYFFTDTGSELPEVYQFLEKLGSRLRKPIAYLTARGIDEYSGSSEGVFSELFKNLYGGFLPSATSRWCTVQLKLKPFERWIAPTLAAGGTVYSYIAIRSDEDRLGYNPANPNIHPVFPFIEDGIDLHGVKNILEVNGIGMPDYYKWRSRSGCTFCFYQQKIEWVGLLEKHPDKFEQAVELERISIESSKQIGRSAFTWSQGETLEELREPDRIEKIKVDFEKRLERHKRRASNILQEDISTEDLDIDEVYGRSADLSVCVTCHK